MIVTTVSQMTALSAKTARRRAAVVTMMTLCLLPALAGISRRSVALAHGTGRFGAVITLSGGDLEAALKGAAEAELFGYVMDDGDWVRVSLQLDEKDAGGNYVASEDGRFDANDEIVLPMEHAGARRDAGTVPSTLSRVSGVVEAKVTDPLDTAFSAYVYVFRAASGPAREEAPVSYDKDTMELKSRSYRLAFANPLVDDFVGIKQLSLYASSRNLLDRLKIRFTVSILGQAPQALTESDLVLFAGQIPGLVPNPLKMGPVRGVMSAAGGFAYADRVDLVGGVPSGLPTGGAGGGITVSGARLSLDFRPEVKGATYADANLKEPVTIDGTADKVPDGPLPGWREYAFTEGRAILLANVATTATQSAKVYYKDDQAIDGDDTGDQQSWGDSGVSAESVEDLAGAGFPGEMVVLPEGRRLTADSLLAQKKNPLLVTWTSTALDAGTEAPTIAPTVRPTPSRAPTRATDKHMIFLPQVVSVYATGSLSRR